MRQPPIISIYRACLHHLCMIQLPSALTCEGHGAGFKDKHLTLLKLCSCWLCAVLCSPLGNACQTAGWRAGGAPAAPPAAPPLTSSAASLSVVPLSSGLSADSRQSGAARGGAGGLTVQLRIQSAGKERQQLLGRSADSGAAGSGIAGACWALRCNPPAAAAADGAAADGAAAAVPLPMVPCSKPHWPLQRSSRLPARICRGIARKPTAGSSRWQQHRHFVPPALLAGWWVGPAQVGLACLPSRSEQL